MTDVLTRAHPGTTETAHEPFAGTVAATLAIAVAPATGRFQPLARSGHRLNAGDLIGHVTGGRGRAQEVRCPVDGDVRGLLARPGQLVMRGQHLAWLDRLATSP